MGSFLAWIAHSGIVQGIIIGAALAFLTAILILNTVIRSMTTTVNGWSAIRDCGMPGNGILTRAACAKALPMVNVFEEAAYWTAARDSSRRPLTGRNAYVLHFPAGGLPPNHAFWSLTATDPVGYAPSSPTRPTSVSGRSSLAVNRDGSLDLYLQAAAPRGRERNWLPTPAGRFKLMLRAYLPGAAILDGTYRVPEVVRSP
ncbi:Protein of unknown function [Paramicrobacterium humi]|uniref:DUF1214 domain-containing protein n=1 Tax=Paramicrobacterium humi TaxID=640635 RepID=A0A1H4PQ60_9MICO|nr:DUF1214 domain-containing protein [Microbacterium humi]SEC09441.1 Protein of unknown function [Microbacterium humi]